MKNPLVSIIVPIYNTEEYLQDCIESLIHQSYNTLEIILINDCSPDRCAVICDEYAQKDSRIKVIHHKENGGLSIARNTGIDASTGEYLFFVDSDDWLALDTIKILLEKMSAYNADCCAGACVTVQENADGSHSYQKRERLPERCVTSREAMERLLIHESSACNRLYCRQAFTKLRFPEGRINEDEPVVLQLYAQMERIVFLDEDTYFYRKRPNSITTSAFSLRQFDCVINSRENLKFVKSSAPDLIPAAEFKYIKTMLWCYVNLRKLKTTEAKQVRHQLRQEIRNNRTVALKNPYMGIMLKALTLFLI